MAIALTTPASLKAGNSVSLAFTGLTAATAYVVTVGSVGTLSWSANDPQFLQVNGKVLNGTSDGSGNLTVSFVPEAGGTRTVNVYLAPAATLFTASFFVGGS